MPQHIEQAGRRWKVGEHIYRTEEAAQRAVKLDRRHHITKRAILAAILERRPIADAIVRARTTGRVK